MANPLRHTPRFSYSDYLTWTDETRWELIAGEAYAMVPAPTTRHQSVQGNLFGLLFNHFRGKGCRPFHSPTDVKLSDHDVVQPDLLVVCDPKKIGEAAILGAPDLVIEILSPTSEARDRREKRQLYENSGVAEYWIVSPYGFVELYRRGEDGRYGAPLLARAGEALTSLRFPDLTVAINEIFEGIALERPPQPAPPGTP
jgi:Uma2 family endonuclease